MKTKRLNRSVALALCLNLMSLYNAKAQQTGNREYVPTDSAKKSLGLIVKVDPVWPAMTFAVPNTAPVFSASVEKFISPEISLQLTGFYSYLNNNIPENTTQSVHTYIVAPEAKYFFGKWKNHTGFYAGAYVFYEHNSDATHMMPTATFPYNEYSTNLDVIVTAGALLGVQYYITKRIETDFLFGLSYGYDFTTITSQNSEAPVYETHAPSYFQPIANINIGYLL